jgi:acetylornithine/succinyldiaminopimelate/putrescine aminotransferase/predicted amino acid dehydrogenase
MNEHSLNPVRRHLLEMFALDTEMVAGSGAVLRDAQGREYLDFLSQYGALPFGHNPPDIWEAVLSAQRDQVPAMIQPLRSLDAERLATRLAEITPGDLGITTFTNSGAETVEAAIKLARMRTGRKTILSAENSFHGKTLGALSATGKPVYQQGFGAPAGDFGHVAYGDLAALRAAFEAGRGDVAAFIVEPIQGEGGVVCPPVGYIDGVIALCREYGVLSILDEIQTGLGRTGEMFACSTGAEVPDMLLLAKALGGGLLPIGACVVRPGAWDDRFGRLHSSTFASNALACRAGLATIDALLANDSAIIRNAATTGSYLRSRLSALQSVYPSVIREVRGQGFMLGLEFQRFDDTAQSALMAFASQNAGIIPLVSSYLLNRHRILTAPLFNDTHVLRLQPPLLTDRPSVDQAVAALGDLCGVLASQDSYRLVLHLVATPKPAAVNSHQKMPPAQVPSTTPDRSPRRFAFLIHYTEAADVLRSDPSFQQFSPSELANWCEWVKQVGPGFARRIPPIASRSGDVTEGWIVSVPLLPKDMRGGSRKMAENMVRDAVDLARAEGATCVGLGAFTSIATRGGETVTGRGTSITSGNTLTTIAAVKSIEAIAERTGINLGDAHVAIIGASGAIGRLASLLLARRAGRLSLVGNAANPFSPRLLSRVADDVCRMLLEHDTAAAPVHANNMSRGLSDMARRMSVDDLSSSTSAERIREIWQRRGTTFPVRWNVSLQDALGDADVVLVATSSELTLIDPDTLQPGTLVCDVARPRNVASSRTEREDVLVFDGGLIKPPFDIDLGPFQTLPKNLCWGCLGETLLLALAGEQRDYSIGSRLSVEDADHLASLADIHGFAPSPLEWQGQPIRESKILRFADHVALRRGWLSVRPSKSIV